MTTTTVPKTLAFTGSNTDGTVGLGLLSMLVGGFVLALSSRLQGRTRRRQV